MAFTRKHYKAIAGIIKARMDEQPKTDSMQYRELRIIASELSWFFASDNGGFDNNRFMSACGIE